MRWSLNPFTSLFNQERSEREPFGPNQTTILDLPVEVRNLIWRDLPASDHSALRQVCARFKWEIENGVGVKATLHGPRLWRDWTFGDEARFIRSWGSHDHASRIADNVDWIQNVLVRSLELKRVTQLTFDPTTLIQSNRFHFRRLAMELEVGSPKTHVIQLLSGYNLLQVIQVTFRSLKPKLSLNQFQEYRVFAVDFGLSVLSTLPGKGSLKELSVTAADGIPYTWSHGSFRGLPVEQLSTQVNYPPQLQVLKLNFPILLPDTCLQAWKPLLDAQTALQDLSLNFGFLYWEYFLAAVQRNATTLRSLDISLSNFRQHRSGLFQHGPVLPNDQFSWLHLLGRALELRTLRLSMSNVYPRYRESPHPTRNLPALQLPSLTTLELHFVRLEQAQLAHIMTNFPGLTDLTLSYWNASTLADYGGPAQELFSAVADVLPGGRFQHMKMTDWCIRSVPQNLKDQIRNLPNYRSVWPVGTLRTYITYFYDSQNEFRVRRRN